MLEKEIIYTHTNSTDRYQIVGNKHEVINSFATRAEAEQALKQLFPFDWSIDNSRWGTAEIVNPGQTVSGVFLSHEEIRAGEESFAKWLQKEIE